MRAKHHLGHTTSDFIFDSLWRHNKEISSTLLLRDAGWVLPSSPNKGSWNIFFNILPYATFAEENPDNMVMIMWKKSYKKILPMKINKNFKELQQCTLYVCVTQY